MILKWMFIVVAVIGISACASSPSEREASLYAELPQLSGIKPVEVAGGVELKLNAESRTEVVRYINRSRSANFEKGEVVQSTDGEVTFTIQNKISNAPGSSDGSKILNKTLTTEKKGKLDLHLLGFPEKGETIDIVQNPRAEVLRAGSYPESSIFYMPTISLPSGSVKVGDTWTMNHQWQGIEDGMTFNLEMVSILKGFVSCGENDECADIEISGDVRVPGGITALVAFKNEWSGRILFARKAGTIMWQRLDSVEVLNTEPVRRRVQSCLESVRVSPPAFRGAQLNPSCDEKATPKRLGVE